MGIELSLASTAGAPETTLPPKAPRAGEPPVSEWTSILGFLFQIEQPAGTEPEPSTISDSPSNTVTSALPDRAHLWAGLIAHLPAVLPSNEIVSSEATDGEPGISLGETDTNTKEVSEGVDAGGGGFELSAAEWTMVPAPVQATHQPSAQPIPGSTEDESSHLAPTYSPPKEHTPNSLCPVLAPAPRDAATVEAVFQVELAASEPPARDPSELIVGDGTRLTGRPELFADRRPVAADQEEFEFIDPKLIQRHSLSVHPDARSQHGSPDESGGEPKSENQESSPPIEQSTGTDRGVLPVPSHPHLGADKAEDPTKELPREQFRQLMADSFRVHVPERRSSPLQFQVRISPSDLGTATAENAGEVRLNLFQRGDEILMRIHGGGEPFAVRAASEWESLVERLKPHGLDATAKAFPAEFGKRDGEPRTPAMPEQAVPSSTSNPGEEQRRFGHEQQQHHQHSQQRQRYSARSGENITPFSLDDGPPNPQLT